MASTATVSVSGNGAIAEYEVSGGAEGKLSNTESESFRVGASGAIVNFLTLKRVGAGKITVKAQMGNLVVEIGSKTKKLKSGSSTTLGSKDTRAVVREQPK